MGGGAARSFHMFKSVANIFNAFEGGLKIFTITEHFNLPPAIFVDDSLRVSRNPAKYGACKKSQIIHV